MSMVYGVWPVLVVSHQIDWEDLNLKCSCALGKDEKQES